MPSFRRQKVETLFGDPDIQWQARDNIAVALYGVSLSPFDSHIVGFDQGNTLHPGNSAAHEPQ